MAAADICKLKQLIHFYDDVNIVNAIYSIKQCWCSFLSLVLVVDCLGSGCWVRSSCVVFWVLTVESVAASEQYVSSSIPDSEGWPRGAWDGPRHHHRHLRHLRQGEPVQWPGEVAAAEKENIFCHVECDAMRLTSHTTIRKLKQVADTFQPCH